MQESNTGLVRENNEDHIFVDTGLEIFCVADGMGGGAEGERASELVCAELGMLLRLQAFDFNARLEIANNALIIANGSIHDYAHDRGYKAMGSTASVLIFDPAQPYSAGICHVGDSRIYRLRKGAITQLTLDHTVGAMLVRRGEDTEYPGCDSREHPLAHILTRAVGASPKVDIDRRLVDVRPGDRFLMCTDGVHDVISDELLAELVGSAPIEDAKAALVKAVEERGAPDNFSFIIIDVAK